MITLSPSPPRDPPPPPPIEDVVAQAEWAEAPEWQQESVEQAKVELQAH